MKKFLGKHCSTIHYVGKDAKGVEKVFSESEKDKLAQYGVRKKMIKRGVI